MPRSQAEIIKQIRGLLDELEKPQDELATLRLEFETNGRLHADHVDASGEYQKRYEKYLALSRKQKSASPSPIDSRGIIRSESMKTSLRKIIATEREKLNEEI